MTGQQRGDHVSGGGLERADGLSRRALLGAAVTAPLAAALAGSASGAPVSKARRRVLRFAHPTDIHVQPELRATEGMRACFEHMLGLKDPPSLIVTGGDLPMDTASTPEARSRVEWDLFKRVLADTVGGRTPIRHTMGNHDVFGRNKQKSKATGDEPVYGKRWFLENFGGERTYQSFDSSSLGGGSGGGSGGGVGGGGGSGPGWRFIILDSIELGPDGNEFVGRISGAQLEWFKGELERTPATTPIVIISHVPIMSVANFFDRDDSEWKTDGPALEIRSSRMHVDCRDLEALFRKHRNVKLCLSGHLHLVDRCEYNGVSYICDGAVSGAKWKGSKRQTAEGYGLIDLYDDGTFDHQYMGFGWKA